MRVHLDTVDPTTAYADLSAREVDRGIREVQRVAAIQAAAALGARWVELHEVVPGQRPRLLERAIRIEAPWAFEAPIDPRQLRLRLVKP
jgi:sugar phosphate isomerase/epimerase